MQDKIFKFNSFVVIQKSTKSMSHEYLGSMVQ